MDFFALFVLSLGLSMDAFAVSVTNGIYFPKAKGKEAFLTAVMFGLFQGIMPIIGFFAGQTFSGYIQGIHYWVALFLLSVIGIKMILDAVKELRNPHQKATPQTLTLKLLFLQAVATSIDALAVGVSLAVINVDIWSSAAVITITTFICCIIGVLIGKKFGAMLKQKAEIFGGALLIALGIKIFLEHIFS